MASHPMFMIRRGRHKYIHCDSDPAQLYDVKADPMERDNLAGNPEHRQLATDFASEVARRWDSAAIREQVLVSQRARRLLNAAMQTGELVSWDYSPTRDPSDDYVRNHMDWSEAGPRHRFPPLH